MQPLIHGTGDVLVSERWSITREHFKQWVRERHRILRDAQPEHKQLSSRSDHSQRLDGSLLLRRGDVVIAVAGENNVKVCKRVVAVVRYLRAPIECMSALTQRNRIASGIARGIANGIAKQTVKQQKPNS